MTLDKYILAAITTNKEKVPSGTCVFYCESDEELQSISANLEAILDGIAHRLTKELYIIVKH
ncbi:hypothetical protein Q73_08225 [Bacillus coahuilensis m2-6]|uniref:Uncharacterized protein n=1 Tax=Bacillus coahuilensis p1.1.43 TaxID=1150625 RepID=A0A147K8X9_9BACI|nr:hypothetical protein [Bacillus coahuilensis]KUP06587.1 hypothetical protein Q75_08695 [Bacillus coahuilensis p1.1.43]KUP07787.1 hypothetical protein Q73_08225 [Bacillus coahuilensis m2-6]